MYIDKLKQKLTNKAKGQLIKAYLVPMRFASRPKISVPKIAPNDTNEPIQPTS